MINLIQNTGDPFELYNIKLAILSWADDNIIFANNINTFVKILQICDSHQYSTQQHLNAIKCRIVELNKQNKKNNNKENENNKDDNKEFKINGTIIPKKTIIKYLGLTIDTSSLNWDVEIQERLEKIDNCTASLKWNKLLGAGTTLSTQRDLALALLRGQATYCMTVIETTKEQTILLERQQSKYLKIILSIPWNASAATARLLLGIEPFECHINELRLKFYYRLMKFHDSNNLAHIFINTDYNNNINHDKNTAIGKT